MVRPDRPDEPSSVWDCRGFGMCASALWHARLGCGATSLLTSRINSWSASTAAWSPSCPLGLGIVGMQQCYDDPSKELEMGGFCSMQQRPYKTKQRLIREPEWNIPLSVCEREREWEWGTKIGLHEVDCILWCRREMCWYVYSNVLLWTWWWSVELHKSQ